MMMVKIMIGLVHLIPGTSTVSVILSILKQFFVGTEDGEF